MTIAWVQGNTVAEWKKAKNYIKGWISILHYTIFLCYLNWEI